MVVLYSVVPVPSALLRLAVEVGDERLTAVVAGISVGAGLRSATLAAAVKSWLVWVR
jgi:hypothetical protein